MSPLANELYERSIHGMSIVHVDVRQLRPSAIAWVSKRKREEFTMKHDRLLLAAFATAASSIWGV